MRLTPNFQYQNMEVLNATGVMRNEMSLRDTTWTEDVLVIFHDSYQCNLFLIINACSCIFGVIWFVMFLMCDKVAIHTKTYG